MLSTGTTTSTASCRSCTRLFPARPWCFASSRSIKGLKLHEYLIDRHTWVEAKTRYLPPFERRNSVLDTTYKRGFVDPYDETLLNKPLQEFHGDYGLYMQESLGGPNNFLLFQVGAQLTGTWRPSPTTWLTGQLHGALIDNYNKFTFTAASELPRVRTNIREYETSSKITMPMLQLTHVGRLDENQYYSVYGGMLESMFGGVGGEWLYRPYRSSLALGIDINAVRQRGFKQDFSFRDYQTTTGHLSLYWDTGVHGILATLQAGRYLAGDVGATLDVSRVFSNGVKMGAWVTKTNVPAAVFGEGSYDKGIYVSIPFDAMMSPVLHVFRQPHLAAAGPGRRRTSGSVGQIDRPDPGCGRIRPALGAVRQRAQESVWRRRR